MVVLTVLRVVKFYLPDHPSPALKKKLAWVDYQKELKIVRNKACTIDLQNSIFFLMPRYILDCEHSFLRVALIICSDD